MPISLEDVRRIADLARIEVTDDEAHALHAKLLSILELVGELQAIDTTDVAPMAHVRDLVLPLREDVVTEADQHALYQQAAPATEDGLYLVPRVVQ